MFVDVIILILYSYTYRIPLDANGVTCPTKVLIFRYGEDSSFDLSKTITANFVVKNLEVSINDNLKYFKLNEYNWNQLKNSTFQVQI